MVLPEDRQAREECDQREGARGCLSARARHAANGSAAAFCLGVLLHRALRSPLKFAHHQVMIRGIGLEHLALDGLEFAGRQTTSASASRIVAATKARLTSPQLMLYVAIFHEFAAPAFAVPLGTCAAAGVIDTARMNQRSDNSGSCPFLQPNFMSHISAPRHREFIRFDPGARVTDAG